MRSVLLSVLRTKLRLKRPTLIALLYPIYMAGLLKLLLVLSAPEAPLPPGPPVPIPPVPQFPVEPLPDVSGVAYDPNTAAVVEDLVSKLEGEWIGFRSRKEMMKYDGNAPVTLEFKLGDHRRSVAALNFVNSDDTPSDWQQTLAVEGVIMRHTLEEQENETFDVSMKQFPRKAGYNESEGEIVTRADEKAWETWQIITAFFMVIAQWPLLQTVAVERGLRRLWFYHMRITLNNGSRSYLANPWLRVYCNYNVSCLLCNSFIVGGLSSVAFITMIYLLLPYEIRPVPSAAIFTLAFIPWLILIWFFGVVIAWISGLLQKKHGGQKYVHQHVSLERSRNSTMRIMGAYSTLAVLIMLALIALQKYAKLQSCFLTIAPSVALYHLIPVGFKVNSASAAGIDVATNTCSPHLSLVVLWFEAVLAVGLVACAPLIGLRSRRRQTNIEGEKALLQRGSEAGRTHSYGTDQNELRPCVNSEEVSLEDGLHIVLGPNGAGKSTMFAKMAEKAVETGVTVRWAPQNAADIFLWRMLTVSELTELYFECYNIPSASVSLLRDLVDELPTGVVDTFSGGEKQRLAVFFALLDLEHLRNISTSILVLLDEPTSGLDVLARRSLQQGILQLTTNTSDAYVVGDDRDSNVPEHSGRSASVYISTHEVIEAVRWPADDWVMVTSSASMPTRVDPHEYSAHELERLYLRSAATATVA